MNQFAILEERFTQPSYGVQNEEAVPEQGLSRGEPPAA